jgi:hypothetical protein
MQKFKQYITEAAGKNLHMTHLEDAVLDGGVTGTRNVINYLRAIRDMLSGNSSAPVSLTTKWDGAPAIFAGVDPADKQFFVAKKGVFNKTPKLYKTENEINDELSGDLADKFKIALKEFSKLGIEGVVQGDLLYTQSDLKTENIGGVSCVTFHPNTIVYAVPKSSDLGKTISKSKIGVVWHTTYRGTSLEGMSASFGKAIATKQKKVNSVWSIDAVFQDESGNATMTKAETDALTAKLSAAGSLFRKIKANKLNELSTNTELNARVNTFINTKVREGTRITNVKAFLIGIQRYIEDAAKKEADKVKQQKTKDAKIQKGKDLLMYFDKRDLKSIGDIFELYNLLVDAKHLIIDKLNQVEGITTLLKTAKGFEPTGQEGFVAIDHIGQNTLKIVDRLEFSKANFSTEYIKGWQK